MANRTDYSGRVLAPEGAGDGALLFGRLASLGLCMLLASLGTSIASVALPTLAVAFKASFEEVQWVVVAYLLVITTLIVSVGRLGDAIGRKTLLLFGLVVFGIASVLCAVAPSLWLLIAGRAIQGLGAAVLMTLTMALVGDTMPKARIGSAMGLLGTMSAIGTALGPSLGGILIAAFGWRTIFAVNVPLALAAFGLAVRYLPRDGNLSRAEGRAERFVFDVWGTLLLAISLAAYAWAMTVGGGRFGGLSQLLLALAVGGLALFVVVESRVASPLIRLAAFRNTAFSAGLFASLSVATVMATTLIVGPFYLSLGLGLSEALVGLVLSVGPIISALSGFVAGRIVDRLGANGMVTGGLGLMAVGCALLAGLPGVFGVAGYIAAIAVLTPGYQLFQAANNTAIMADVPANRRGVISGMLNLARNFGLITGTSVIGAVFAAASGVADIKAASAKAIGTGLQMTFSLTAGLIVIAMVIVVLGRAVARRGPAPVSDPF